MSEYWIVDLEARLVECWTPADQPPQILTDGLECRPLGEATPQLSLDLTGFFAEVLDD
jgi:Uma2 family endonuclease